MEAEGQHCLKYSQVTLFLTLQCKQASGPEPQSLQFISTAQGRYESHCSCMQLGLLTHSWWKLPFFTRHRSTSPQMPTTAASILRQEVLQLSKPLINSLIRKLRCIKSSLHPHSLPRGIYNTFQFDENCRLLPSRILHLLPPTSF